MPAEPANSGTIVPTEVKNMSGVVLVLEKNMGEVRDASAVPSRGPIVTPRPDVTLVRVWNFACLRRCSMDGQSC